MRILCGVQRTSGRTIFTNLMPASNNSVDDIRQLVEQVRIPPQIGKYKVYIIDEVHMLSASAFNAFLKTLEEPPRHAIFILANDREAQRFFRPFFPVARFMISTGLVWRNTGESPVICSIRKKQSQQNRKH